MVRIACIGDNVVDINYVSRKIYPGGNCVNVAVYCSQLGHYAEYIGVLADDKYAGVVTKSLKQNRVAFGRSVIRHGETGRCFCNLTNGERVLGDENDGGLVKSEPLDIDSSLVEYVKSFDVIHTSCYSYLDDQLSRLKESGVPILYDFSTEWDREKCAAICPHIDYVLFSDQCGTSSAEKEYTLKAAVEKYCCSLAVMTMGSEGSCVYDGSRFYRKEPYNIEGGARDTTGCGDSWISGFITTYISGKKTFSNQFITKENERDWRESLIKFSMCAGNLKARQTSQTDGAFGCGIDLKA